MSSAFKMVVFGLFFAVQSSYAQMDTVFYKPDSTLAEVHQKLNSLGAKPSAAVDSINQITSSLHYTVDTLAPDVTRYNQKLDSITNRIQFKIDSLSSLGQPTAIYTRLLDSLRQSNPLQTLEKAEVKINQVNQKINQPINKVENMVNEKLNLMRSEGGADANLPGNLDLPGAEGQLPGGAAPNLNSELPGGTKNNLNLNAPELPNLKEKLPGGDELSQVQQTLGQVGEVTGQVQGYSADVKNIASGNLEQVEQLPQTLEQQAMKLDELQGFQEQTEALDGVKDMASVGNDPEALKEQAIQQLPKLAKNHFAGQEAVLKQAMDKVSKYKSKYSELTSLKDVPKRRPNEMRGKPSVERLVPGITFQVQNSERVLLDYSPSLGFRISGRLTAGLGWNERVGIGKKLRFTRADRIYGPRTYVSFRWKKGISFRADVEQLHTYMPPTLGGTGSDPDRHDWVWSVFLGIKKDYQFMKGVKGNFQFMYNLYDDRDSSPYLSRFNIRFGFEFPLKKRKMPEPVSARHSD